MIYYIRYMITKNIFRNEVKDILLSYMLEGKIKPNERLSLPEIARDLDVSVTPIREALTQLTETGILTYKANRGFFVAQLTNKEIREIYDLIACLEGEAVRKTVYSDKILSELVQINQQFKRCRSAKEKLYVDRLFHHKLIENFDNQHAHKIIENLRIKISIHELEFMQSEFESGSGEMHDKIISLLKSNKKSDAIKVLRENWMIGISLVAK